METANPRKEELPTPLCAEDKDLIRNELGSIISSKLFSRSSRHRVIFRYLVQSKLEGRESEITEQAIAKQAFGRGKGFRPELDSSVRVEISRLRTRLADYYASEGQTADIEISLPVGYVPRFSKRRASKAEAAGPLQSDNDVGYRLAQLDAHLTREISIVTAKQLFSKSENVDQCSRTSGVYDSDPDGQTKNRDRTFFPGKHWLWILLAVAVIAVVSIPMIGKASLTARQRPSLVTWYPGGENEPSLSPEGDRVAFVWNGGSDANFDIYTKRLHGNQVFRLTKAPALDHSPAWSPDGKKIAFLRRLPGMRQAVFVVPVEGGAETKITEIETMISGICWTPDSQYLIVPDRPNGVPLALFLHSISTGERHRLTDYFAAFHPAISPDGRTLAFLQEQNGPTMLHFLSLDRKFLPAGSARSSRASMTAMRYLRWSQDGRSLVFSVTHDQSWQAYRYWIASEETEALQALGDGIRTIEELPGSRAFLVTRGREHRTVVKVPLPGVPNTAQPEIISVSDDGEPSISPDGRFLAFVSTRNGVPKLTISRVGGSATKSIEIDNRELTHPRWSPDSRAIVVTTWKENRPKIYRTEADSGKTTELFLDGAHNSNASYSRDGKWVYFVSNISGTRQVWKAPSTGGKPVLVIASPVDYMEESLDGQYLLYSWNSNIYRLSLKEQPTIQLINRFDAALFRPGRTGIYYETRDLENGLCRIMFQAFSGKPANSVFAPRQEILGFTSIPGFSVSSDEQALFAETRELETNLEMVPSE
jgi:Tol biopolymer transport system component